MSKLLEKLKKRFSSGMDLLSSFHLEVDRRGRGLRVLIGGVKGIVNVEPDTVKFRTEMGNLTFFGENLEISVFENKTVEICGRIYSAEISYDKN